MAFGSLTLDGYWDAAANLVVGSPRQAGVPVRLKSGRVNNPLLFQVTVAGTTNLDGIASWSVGDWAVNFGYGWGKFAGPNVPGAGLSPALIGALGGIQLAPRPTGAFIYGYDSLGVPLYDVPVGITNSDEIRIRSSDVPQDYVTNAQPYLQAMLNQAQATGKRLILPDTGNRYLALDAPLVATPGVQRAGGGSGAFLYDSANQPLRNDIRIEGNCNTLVPRFTGYALDLNPTMSLAEMADSSKAGFNSSRLDIRNLNFNLNSAPGVQAMRLGRQGRTFADSVYYSQIHGICVNQINGLNTSPADHGVLFEGYLFGIEMEGWRLNAIGGGLWMVIDSTTPGCFQGSFFFKDFQSLGNQAKSPLRISVLAGTSGARSAVRGLHFQDAQIYGPGTYFEVSGQADIGDVWFGPGCQWDGVFGVPSNVGEAVIRAASVQGGRIFNCFWTSPYIQGMNGPAYRMVTDSGTAIITNQQINGGLITLMSNPGGGLFDLQGGHAGGIVLNGIDFQACTAGAYVVSAGADSVSMHNCTSNQDTTGASVIDNAIYATGTLNRVSATGNLLTATNKTGMIAGSPTIGAQIVTANQLY